MGSCKRCSIHHFAHGMSVVKRTLVVSDVRVAIKKPKLELFCSGKIRQISGKENVGTVEVMSGRVRSTRSKKYALI